MASTLLILDVKDLWDNAYKSFGNKCRLDFSKILKKAKVNNNKASHSGEETGLTIA
jgi:hypothetical protein